MSIPEAAQPDPPFDAEQFLDAELQEHRCAIDATAVGLARPFLSVLRMWEAAIRGGGKLLFFGNGGSAADAQHIAAELVVRYKSERPAIAAIALSTDTSALTACANDYGFETIFARQIEALARPGDVAVGLSTSGGSPNVLNALRAARRMSLGTVGLTGENGAKMRELCDELIVVRSPVTARIQETHITIGHMLCKALEARLGFAGRT